MLISKIYNHNAKSNNKQQHNQSGASNSRILTPSSIPIFVLPPTIDTFNSNGLKPELNDSFDCLSIKLADDEPVSVDTNQNEITLTSATNKSTSRTSKLSKNASYSSASAYATDLRNSLNRSFDLTNLSHNPSVTSLNNLKNQISTASSNHLKPLFKHKMNQSNSISNPSGNSNSPAQTPSNTNVNSFFEMNAACTNGLNDEENELKNKENYCNFWVLNNSNRSTEYLNEKKSMNGSIKSNDSSCSAYLKNRNDSNLNDNIAHNSLIAARSQAAAVSTYTIANNTNKHVDDEYMNRAKEEEKLQREYLVNLLKQLETEQGTEHAYAKLNNHVTSVDDSKHANSSNKKTKRSKSETFLEINSTRLPLNGNTKENNKITETINNKPNQNASRKTTKTNKSSLDPNQEENLRRFSFRSIFKSKHLNKSHQNMNSTNTQKSSKHLDSIHNVFNTNISSNAASLSQLSSNNSSLDKTSSNKLSVFDLTRAATRLSNSNLINPFNSNDPAVPNSLLTFKRQSFKLSRRFNQRRTLDDDVDADNEETNQLDDVEKAFNDFYLKNKIENPLRGGTHSSDDDTNRLIKAKPRRSLFSTLFHSHRESDFDRSKNLTFDTNGRRKFKLFKNRSKVVLSYNDEEAASNNFGEYVHNVQNLNLALIEHEYKRHSVKDIIYLKLNKSLFASSGSKRRSTPETNALIDVSIERLQQNSKNLHVLSMNLKNLKVEPLFEINHVKAKLTYIKICLVDSDEISNECKNKKDNNVNLIQNGSSNSKTKIKNFARIQRLKRIKLKFNANNKNLQKPVDFELSDDHFMSVNNEATLMLTQPNQVTARKSLNEPLYFFLFSIELHSYLPVSRKILSSTFSKKKKIYRGQCQLNENFIRMTQFAKKFELHEV